MTTRGVIEISGQRQLAAKRGPGWQPPLAPQPKLVLLVGQQGAGKDTVAALMGMCGWERLSAGDAIRRDVEQHCESAGFTRDEVWRKPTSERMRAHLQIRGDWMLREPENLLRAMGLYDMLPGHRYVVSDARSDVEYEFARERGGRVWHVVNPRAPDPRLSWRFSTLREYSWLYVSIRAIDSTTKTISLVMAIGRYPQKISKQSPCTCLFLIYDRAHGCLTSDQHVFSRESAFG